MAADYSRQTSTGWEVIDEGLNEYGLTKLMDDKTHFPVAIVGMSCHMPGVESIAEYRKVLVDQLRTYDEIPHERWSQEEWYGGPDVKLGFTNSKVAGFIPYLWDFDHSFFNTSPKEALSMDPQQYRVMECTQEAMDDAGLTKETLPHNTAVYMSMKMGEQSLVCAENVNIINPYILTGGAHTVTANRVNYFYDIRGGSMGVEGSCTAAMHSIHFGIWSLWNHECDAVIAGGVSHIVSPHFHMNQCHRDMLSKNGDAAPFDASADGRIRSEGVGCIIIRPLADAIRDGDHVHCVIRASVVGYHGKNMDITRHDSNSVADTMGSLYDRFGLSTDKVDYIEAHATGIPSEDKIEADALSKVFSGRLDTLKVGSCKANVGHTESASGIAQIVKAATMLRNREYLPQRNFNKLNPEIQEEGCNIEVQSQHEKYTKDKNMMIGINSMSFSGQIVHMVLEEYKNNENKINPADIAGWKFGVSGDKGRTIPIVLSAKNPTALKDMAQRWIDYENDEEDAQVVSSWLSSKRSHYSHRLMVLANSAEDVKCKLQDFIEGNPNEEVMTGTAPSNFKKPKICFVFPGQGQQWFGMGQKLYANEPVYRNIVNECDSIWQRESGYSFLEKFKLFVSDTAGVNPTDIDEILVCQPAIVSHQIALAALMIHWGITPDMTIGHSLGEMASAYLAGGMTLTECITNLYHRATTQSTLSGTGSMAAARFTPDEADKFCQGDNELYVACYNSTENVTVAGTTGRVKQLAEENPKKLKVIRVKAAFHTRLMRPVKQQFFERMVGKYQDKFVEDGPIMYSTVSQGVNRGPYGAEYWWKNIEEPVYFAQANAQLFKDHGSDVIFVEIGAAATLLSCIRQTAKKYGMNPVGYVACGARSKDDQVAALKGLAQLYLMGFSVDWENVTKNCAKYVQLPTYPFQRVHFRLESELNTERRLGKQDKSYRGRSGEIDIQMHPFLADYVVKGETLFPSSGFVEYLMEHCETESKCLIDVKITKNPKVFSRVARGDYSRLFFETVEDGSRLSLITSRDAWNKDRQQQDMLYASCTKFDQSITTLPTTLDLSSINVRCPVLQESSCIYEHFTECGLQYGKSFQVMQELRIGDGEAVGLLLPETNKYECIKTSTLDGAFQTAHAAFVQSNSTYMVTGIDYVQLNGDCLPLNQEFYVYAKLVDWNTDNFKSDIYITDTMGNILTSCSGCRFEKIEVPFDVSAYIYQREYKEVVPQPEQRNEYVVVYGPHDVDIAKHLTVQTISIKEFLKMKLASEISVAYLWNPQNSFTRISRSGLSTMEPDHLVLNDVNEIMAALENKNKSLAVIIPNGYETSGLMSGYISSMSCRCGVQATQIQVNRDNTVAMAREINDALHMCTENTDIQVKAGKITHSILKRTIDVTENIKPTRQNRKSLTEQKTSDIKPGQVQIKAKVFCQIGQFIQCCGLVERTASNVTKVKTGDNVIVLHSPTRSSTITCSERNVMLIEPNMSWGTASAAGATYGIALHVLNDLMKLKSGETIYIPENNTLLGESLIRIARNLGANILSNRNEQKNPLSYVKYVDPNTLDFRKDALKFTGEKGVDVFVSHCNDIFDELHDVASVNSRMCIMSFDNERITLSMDDRLTTYYFDAKDLLTRRPDIMEDNIMKVQAMVKDGQIPELDISTAIISPNMVSIHRDISVFLKPEDFEGDTPGIPELELIADGTYMVTGGYDSFALEMARWLVSKGARHIVLVSRHGRTRNVHRYALQNLQQSGAQVHEIRADLSEVEEIGKVFIQLKQIGCPTLRGIFHTTGTSVRRSPENISNLGSEQSTVARNLHHACRTRGILLDYFVMLSSVAGFGSCIHLAESAATSADLRLLAEERQKSGLPGLNMQIGLTDSVSAPEAEVLMSQAGCMRLPTKVYLEAMEYILQREQSPASVIVVDQDWGKTIQVNPGIRSYLEDVFCELTKNGRQSEQDKDQIVQYLSKELGWPAEYFDAEIPMKNFGLDQLLGNDFVTWFQQKYDVTLTLQDIDSGITLNNIFNMLSI